MTSNFLFLEVARLFFVNWLGRKDSNLRMPDPKPGALPLGDAPIKLKIQRMQNFRQILKGFDIRAAKLFRLQRLAIPALILI